MDDTGSEATGTAGRLFGGQIVSCGKPTLEGAVVEVTVRALQGRLLLKEYAARRRGEDFDRMKYATVEILTLDPLPCWSGLSEELYRERIASLVEQIEAEARAERERSGRAPLGREAVLSQNPHSKPLRTKQSPAPRFHAFRKSVRRELYEAYAWFVAAFRDASEKLRAGDLSARFPSGSFPPALPFVG